MKLASPAFKDNESIPVEYTCDGANINPPFEFIDVPENTKSLVLIMDDHDVPKDLIPSGTFDHWVVFNIPAQTTGVAENEKLNGVYGANSAGKSEYAGPCPPDREHRYIFQLFALDSMFDLESGATKQEVLEVIQGHVLAEAKFIGRFNRKA